MLPSMNRRKRGSLSSFNSLQTFLPSVAGLKEKKLKNHALSTGMMLLHPSLALLSSSFFFQNTCHSYFQRQHFLFPIQLLYLVHLSLFSVQHTFSLLFNSEEQTQNDYVLYYI
jgi:hypothetical protein